MTGKGPAPRATAVSSEAGEVSDAGDGGVIDAGVDAETGGEAVKGAGVAYGRRDEGGGSSILSATERPLSVVAMLASGVSLRA